MPEELARKYAVVPVSLHNNSLTIASADPTNFVAIDNLVKITGHDIRQIVATRSDIESCIAELYGEGGMLKSAIEASYKTDGKPVRRAEAADKLSLDIGSDDAEKAPVVKLTDLLIRQAVKMKASDIHIEPFSDKLTIRFRVDGILQEIPPPDKSMMLPLISRIKILSKLDISEKRLPQDGSFSASIENRVIDFRVSTIPTIHGEKAVLRILDKSAVSLNLDTLGFEAKELEIFRKIIRKPYGMILITGPTGSGKTTTLYSALNEIKGGDKNIITIEDPVEYQMSGINQVQAKPGIGLTFAAGLRSFLRQDPDVMLVGETRDLETAQICVRAALTGHLVFSTIHTNDAPTTINRLVDIGVEPYVVASSLLMVVAQRLLRKLCPKCKEPFEPPAGILPKGWTGKGTFFKPKGCDACSRIGYSGRVAIYEIMGMNEKLSELVTRRVSTQELREAARDGGMSTLEDSGFRKAAAGLTSIEEVMRLTLTNIA
jgi:type II secretory ATPase GspE/PulE/Tfp pilus assembly ATPase PilB-like protein